MTHGSKLVLVLMFVALPGGPARADDACTQGCARERNTCMADVAKHGGPRPQQCIQELRACQAECRTPPKPKPTPEAKQVGEACGAAKCSAPHLACFDGLCACNPGFVACGTKCVDVVTDEHSCGACDVHCAAGEACRAGVCVPAKDKPPAPKASSVSAIFPVTPGQCSQYESHPVMSGNAGIMFQACGNGGIGQLVSWARVSSPTAWTVSTTVTASQATNEAKGTPFLPPACGPKGKASQTDCPLVAGGDVWATTSGFSGLEYVAARVSWNPFAAPFNDPSKTDHQSSPGLVAVAAKDLEAADLPHARWALPMSVADDGLTAAYDPGGSSLWIAATCGADEGPSAYHPCTFLFPTCEGRVDSATCRRAKIGAAGKEYADPMLHLPDSKRGNAGHTTVNVNPCTHHALVSFLESDASSSGSGWVTVAAVDHKGEIVAHWHFKQPWPGGDTKCPDASKAKQANCTVRPLCPDPTATNTNCCDKADACDNGSTPSFVSRVVARVQTDVKVIGRGADAKCTLYVGWDQAKGSPGPVRRAATLGSIDVSAGPDKREKQTAPFKLLTQVEHEGESIDATPVASRFGDAVGLIYVQRDPTGATERLRARVTLDGTFDTFTDLPVSKKNADAWFGDSLSELLGGVPGGEILATWPDSSSSSCSTIEGALITVGPAAGHAHAPEPPEAAAPARPDPKLWRAIPDEPHHLSR